MVKYSIGLTALMAITTTNAATNEQKKSNLRNIEEQQESQQQKRTLSYNKYTDQPTYSPTNVPTTYFPTTYEPTAWEGDEHTTDDPTESPVIHFVWKGDGHKRIVDWNDDGWLTYDTKKSGDSTWGSSICEESPIKPRWSGPASKGGKGSKSWHSGTASKGGKGELWSGTSSKSSKWTGGTTSGVWSAASSHDDTWEASPTTSPVWSGDTWESPPPTDSPVKEWKPDGWESDGWKPPRLGTKASSPSGAKGRKMMWNPFAKWGASTESTADTWESTSSPTKSPVETWSDDGWIASKSSKGGSGWSKGSKGWSSHSKGGKGGWTGTSKASKGSKGESSWKRASIHHSPAPTICETDKPTSSPTNCDTDRKWYVTLDGKSCTNGYHPPSDEDDLYDTAEECCKEELNHGTPELYYEGYNIEYKCHIIDVCIDAPSPTTSPTYKPTSCEERKWYDMYGKCTNGDNPPDDKDDLFETLDKCCYKTQYASVDKCHYKDTCAHPTKPPTPSPSKEPTPEPTPKPTTCEERKWYDAYGKCTNGDNPPDDEDHLFETLDKCCYKTQYASVDECHYKDTCAHPTMPPTPSPSKEPTPEPTPKPTTPEPTTDPLTDTPTYVPTTPSPTDGSTTLPPTLLPTPLATCPGFSWAYVPKSHPDSTDKFENACIFYTWGNIPYGYTPYDSEDECCEANFGNSGGGKYGGSDMVAPYYKPPEECRSFDFCNDIIVPDPPTPEPTLMPTELGTVTVSKEVTAPPTLPNIRGSA